jgi:uncharacterized protein
VPPAALLLPVLAAAASSAPADCVGKTDAVARAICADVTLRDQDAQMQRLYTSALQLPAPHRAAQEARQGAWLRTRAACTAVQDVHGCIAEQLGRRIVELKVVLGRMPVFAAVTYVCQGKTPMPVHAAYYRSEPPAVRLSFSGHDLIAFAAPSGSGTRYAGDGVEIWEHQGVARFTWNGVPMECPKQ